MTDLLTTRDVATICRTGVPYLEVRREFDETMHRVRRDRRNQPAIYRALRQGKKLFEGHKIGGKTPGSVYVYRWEREEVVDMYEMIEEALR